MGSPHVLADAPKVALIGGGFIGPVHAEALRRIGAPIVGLLGSSPDRARAVAERLGIARVYNDLDDLLGDPAVDSVHVASPNRNHFEQARQALKSGRHVICERPFATTSVETAMLRSLAKSRPNQAAALNANLRFYPFCVEMQARVLGGNLGRILSVTGSYEQDWLLKPEEYNWRVEPDGGANLRAASELGLRWVDLAQFVVGRRVEAVFADLAIFFPERLRPAGPGGGGPGETIEVATEDYGGILLRLVDNILGTLHVSQAAAGRRDRLVLEIAGTKAMMTWDSDEPEHLWIGRRGRDSRLTDRGPTPALPEAGGWARHPGRYLDPLVESYQQLFLAVYGWVGSGMNPPAPFPTIVDGHREARLGEAIARSAREGTWVRMPSD